MKAWTRFWGVGVFAALVLLVLLFWWLFADLLIERTVENVGTGLVGARVELDSADLSVAPVSLVLSGLQVTNPDAPMTNAFEARRIAASIDALPLLRRKVLIDQLAIEGLRFGTPREESGAVSGWAQRARGLVEQSVPELELPSFEKPDVEAILASEDLESLAIIKEAQSEIDRLVESWKERLASLPDEERFRAYRERFEALKGAGTANALGSAQELLALQKEVRSDLDALRDAATALGEDAKGVETLSKRAAEAPGQDVRRLQDKYGLSPEGLANLSQRLLGPGVSQWIRQGLEWWQRLEPLVERIEAVSGGDGAAQPVRNLRGRGIDVRFPEYRPVPDFLIRHTEVGLELDAGAFSGSIDDITPDQPVHGKPLTLAFRGENLAAVRSVVLTGTVKRMQPAAASDEFQLRVRDLAVEGLPLSESQAWALELERGTLNFDGTGGRVGEEISASLSAALASASLVPRFGESGPVADSIAQVLAGVRSFAVDASVRGKIDDYALELRSDLDGLLRQAVTKLVSTQMSEFRSRLEEKVTARTSGPLGALQGSASKMGGLEKQVASRIDLGRDALAAGEGGMKLPGGLKLPF